MKEIKVQDAVGKILVHDVTQIIRGITKDAKFRKGHVIVAEDVPELLKLGKENIFVWEDDENFLHENDAAEILKDICQGENLSASEVKEGKIELSATCDGVFYVDENILNEINSVDEICIATLKNKIPVKKNKICAGMRVIPLRIEKNKMQIVKNIAADKKILKISPYKNFKIGLIVTGSEVFHNRIEDTFSPVIDAKLKSFGQNIFAKKISDDSKEMTQNFIEEFLKNGCDLIICTCGMSVDPDDRTPAAIKNSADEIITYGVPVLPGAMFMLAYKKNIPIMGLPGCVMYCSKTIFDLVLPRILTGEKLCKNDFVKMGVGGLL